MNLNARVTFPFLTRFLIAILLTICLILLSIYPVFSQCVLPGINAISITPVTCAGGTTGRIQVTGTGGTAPYTYFWTTGQGTSHTISNLRAGDYTVTATDANGCQATKTFAVPELLAAGPNTTDATVCKGSTVALSASGAPVGGSYKWYTTVTGGTALPGEISATFTTPEIRSTTAWYVSKVDASNCESARAPVAAKMLNPLYPFVDLDSALIMHYKFDNNYVDETGRHSSATLGYGSLSAFMKDRHGINRMAAAVEDLSGTGAGPFTYLDFGASSDLQALTDKLTISLWMRRTVSSGTLAPMLNKWQNGSGFYIGAYLDNSSPGARKVLWKIAGTQVVSSQDLPNNNSWHHIVCVYTGTELRIYQNGILTGSTPFTGNIPATTVNLMAGRQADSAVASAFTGVLDDLRIYNRTLTADEIKTIYNDESVAFSNGPVCAESTINLSTFNVPQATFQWSGPSGFSTPLRNPAIADAASTHAGSYSLQVSKYGCTTPAQKTSVTVDPLPSTTITPSGATTFCDGNNITLSAPGATSWLWSTGATTRTITVSQQNTYSVTVTGSNGCSDTSDPLDVTVTPVNDAPSFTGGADVVAYEGVPHVVGSWATGISPGPAEATQAVNFQVSNDNNALFSIQPSVTASGDLSFTPAQDIAGVATVTIFLKDDGGTTCGVDQSASQTFTITVNNVNDAPSFVKGSDVAIDEDAGAQTFTGWATGVSAGAGEGGQVLNFVVSNDNNNLFTAQPFLDAAGNLSFTPAPDAWGSATVTASLRDDGGTSNGGVDESTDQTFTITVNNVNDAPSFVKGTDVAIDEDAGAQTFTGWATGVSAGAGEGGQVLNFVVSNDNNNLFTAQPFLDAAGNLSFTPAPDAWGSATVTASLRDDGGTSNGGVDQSTDQTFTITVNNVNDAPSFVKGTDVAIDEDAGAQTFTGWATGLSAGAGEGGQVLDFVVSNDNNSLFTAQPFIDAAGNLSLTPAPDAWGSATVTAFVHDDGSTANGGIEQSAIQTFTITVNAVNDAPSFTAGNNIVVAEDAAAQIIQGWASAIAVGAGEEAQTLTFIVSNSRPALFTTLPAITSSGDLSFTVAPGVSGVATITVSLKDNGGTANGGTDQSGASTFTITVNAVNDAPSFTMGNDVIINEDASDYHAPWATAISAGDPDQVLTFVVSASNTQLFAVQPAITASGTLTFQLKPDVSGSSDVTVYLKDDGGTSNGGADRSTMETFQIIVNPVNDAPYADAVDNIVASLNTAVVPVELTGIHPGVGEETQQLSITAFAGDPSIVTDIQVTPLPNGSASLTLSLVPDASGVVRITVVIRDNGGTAAGGVDETTLSFILTVEGEDQRVFLPNLFSPDGNGTNDAFRVRGIGIAEIRFGVYTAEGQELFSTTDVTTATQTGWDGTYKGQQMPSGTYTWILQGKYTDGQPLTNSNTRFGQFMLMR